VLVAGQFSQFGGTTLGNLVRLNSDGSIDASFSTGTSTNGQILALAVQPDGKILLAGQFNQFNGSAAGRIVRLNPNGTLDSGFNPGAGANNTIHAMVLQPDGKILVAGQFNQYAGSSAGRIVRLNTNGTRDSGFNPGTGAQSIVHAMVLQPDGKVIVAGQFNQFGGNMVGRIVRLNANGTLDTGFNPGSGANTTIHTLALQPDGKVIVGGQFVSFNGETVNRIVRLNGNGSIDPSFVTSGGIGGTVLAAAIEHPAGRAAQYLWGRPCGPHHTCVAQRWYRSRFSPR
jgi:uncharacterized delta-60 repeat protein